MNDPRVAVVGLGHALLGDDALGLAVVQELERVYQVPPSVSVIDGGTAGLDLASHLLDCERLIFVDALVATEPPGTIRTFGHDELSALRPDGPRLAPHEPSIADALALLSLTGRAPLEALLVGIVPECLEVGVELSPVVARAVPRALDEVVGHLKRFGVEVSPRPGTRATGIVIELEGVVQGIGMRPWVLRTAKRLGLRGSVANGSKGVVIHAHGEPSAQLELVRLLHSAPPPRSRVDALRTFTLEATGPADFTIAASETSARPVPSIPADLALCDACRRELDDPENRRFEYAFTHCVDCGPRHSIVTALPYDRAATSMSAFTPCRACSHEYEDERDRRCHAQAIACPECGPQLWLESPLGARTGSKDLIGEVARRLAAGQILAIQGLGGFHLACDATNESAVATLRQRKQRDEKPFAVMVRDLAAANAVAELDDRARAALSSAERPIVIAWARASGIAANVAPASARIAVFLPYTPFHHLLCKRFERPLVLTSGNVSGEPIAVSRSDAERTLAAVADAFVFHDRPIVRRVEDSVVTSTGSDIQLLRRARGYAPRAIALPFSAPEPVLAVGGHSKNTACLVVGDRAYLTSHLGDLESYEAERAFADDVRDLEQLFGVCPRVIAHDLHPDYASTRYARTRPDARLFGVQHHHAHVLAVLAEQRLQQPVVAAAFDGTGFGSDGTLWGAEILRVDGLSCERLFSIRPLKLAGGERAVRDIWRLAWALLRDAFGAQASDVAAALGSFAAVPVGMRALLTHLLETQVNVVEARSMGRYFDAFAALCFGQAQVSFEGQAAMALEDAAGRGSFEPYPFALPRAAACAARMSEDNELDLRPTVRAAALELMAGESAARVAGRFHETLVEASACMLESAGGRALPVVLTGGCFQNQRLNSGVRRRLANARVIGFGEVPVNDGGIALGQAFAAVLALREGVI